ncbi:hypothetical protein [Porphyromonas pogonae]|uniref:hypothetical protein n=1 Tax=Porphyromonas pogonae TaxID=867595 RepID=UPI002E79344C|nr:hypothetical protein [Porphyromonas pogonae]
MTKRESRKQRSNLPAMQRSHFVSLVLRGLFIHFTLINHPSPRRDNQYDKNESKTCLSLFARGI